MTAALNEQTLIQSLQWRYATKQFDKSKTIPEKTWQAIEKSLVLTPSSFGLQPWKFIVVTSDEMKQKLLPHSWNQAQVTDCSHFVVLCAREKMDHAEISRFLQSTADARDVDVSTLDGYGDMMRGFVSAMDEDGLLTWAKHQVYIALGQLMSSAAVLGVDACPMEGISPSDFDQLLDLEGSGFRTTVACAMGYRSDDDKYAQLAKVRYSTEEVIEHL